MTVKALYQAITGDVHAHQRTIAAELAREPARRQLAVRLRAQGHTLREIGRRLKRTHGTAQDLILRTMLAMHKRIYGLPRYHLHGRSRRRTVGE